MATKRAFVKESETDSPPKKRLRSSCAQNNLDSEGDNSSTNATDASNNNGHSSSTNNNVDTKNACFESLSFEYQLKEASKETISHFASHCLSNYEKNNKNFCKDFVGKTEYYFEFRQLMNDDNDDIFQRLGILFGDKLCDWKHYLCPNNNNNFIVTINDFVGIMRGAILFILYELDMNIESGLNDGNGNDNKTTENEKTKQIIVKIPLTGVDLHLRKQGLGKLVSYYLVSKITSIVNSMMNKKNGSNNDNENDNNRINFEIIVLVIDESNAPYFWQKCGFVKIPQRLKEYKSKFDRPKKDDESSKTNTDSNSNANTNGNSKEVSQESCKDDRQECKDETNEKNKEKVKEGQLRLRKYESDNTLNNLIFQKDKLIKNGFVTENEMELLVFVYNGIKDEKLVYQSDLFEKFKKPYYTNLHQRYAKREEIAQLEKELEEYKKKQAEKKKLEKNNEDDYDSEEDEDYDIADDITNGNNVHSDDDDQDFEDDEDEDEDGDDDGDHDGDDDE